MSRFNQVTASEKPWLNEEDPYHRTVYPLSWGKKSSYALFSPGIDRFILVDDYDPWVMLETSQVLSSKISNIVYVLDQETKYFDNRDCLLHTTKHKVEEKIYGGPTVMSHRQSSFMMKIRPNSIIEAGWPIDFNKSDRIEALLKLKEYSMFCLRMIHSLNIAFNFKNPFPEKHYLENFFKDEYPKDFIVRADNTTCTEGMVSLIKNILYSSNSIEDALDQIDQAWRTHSQNDILGFRQSFYFVAGLKQPNDLEKLGAQGTIDKDRNDQTMWVV